MQRDGTNARSNGDRRAVAASRGQTNLDFAIGISLFLGVLIFIFLFIPGLLSPFTTGAQAETVTSNRIADDLTKSMLGNPERPHTVDRFCTVEFFNGTGPTQCRYADGDLATQFGIDGSGQNVNLTVRGNLSTAGDGSDILCWDDGGERFVEATSAGCNPGGDVDDAVLTRGDPAPNANDETVTALRVVALGRHDVTLYVEMW